MAYLTKSIGLGGDGPLEKLSAELKLKREKNELQMDTWASNDATVSSLSASLAPGDLEVANRFMKELDALETDWSNKPTSEARRAIDALQKKAITYVQASTARNSADLEAYQDVLNNPSAYNISKEEAAEMYAERGRARGDENLTFDRDSNDILFSQDSNSISVFQDAKITGSDPLVYPKKSQLETIYPDWAASNAANYNGVDDGDLEGKIANAAIQNSLSDPKLQQTVALSFLSESGDLNGLSSEAATQAMNRVINDPEKYTEAVESWASTMANNIKEDRAAAAGNALRDGVSAEEGNFKGFFIPEDFQSDEITSFLEGFDSVTAGFDEFYQLKTSIDSSFSRNLKEGESIIAFNVGSDGKIYAVMETVTGSKEDDDLSVKTEIKTYAASDDDGIFKTIKESNPNTYTSMVTESAARSERAKAAKATQDNETARKNSRAEHAAKDAKNAVTPAVENNIEENTVAANTGMLQDPSEEYQSTLNDLRSAASFVDATAGFIGISTVSQFVRQIQEQPLPVQRSMIEARLADAETPKRQFADLNKMLNILKSDNVEAASEEDLSEMIGDLEVRAIDNNLAQEDAGEEADLDEGSRLRSENDDIQNQIDAINSSLPSTDAGEGTGADSNNPPATVDPPLTIDPGVDGPMNEPRFKTEKGGIYTSDQLSANLEGWENELLAGTREGQTVKSGVAVKAKNFGNLRPNNANPYHSGVYEVSPAELDDEGNVIKEANQYQNFANYDEGLKGLIWDVKSKQHLDGLSSSAVGSDANIIAVMKKYAPSSDSNNPVGYTNHIVKFVNERLGLSGEEAFTSESKASDFPTELLVEAIISKEDISLYKEMKERSYFNESKISGIAQGINRARTTELRNRA